MSRSTLCLNLSFLLVIVTEIQALPKSKKKIEKPCDVKVMGQMSVHISLWYKGTERQLFKPEDEAFFPLSNHM